MKLPLPLLAIAVLTFASCRSLNSATYIQPEKQFVLGNNAHGAFSIALQNQSAATLTLYELAMTGERKTIRVVTPGGRARVNVPANTGVVIANDSRDTATVLLRVTGDTGLGMQYGDSRR